MVMAGTLIVMVINGQAGTLMVGSGRLAVDRWTPAKVAGNGR